MRAPGQGASWHRDRPRHPQCSRGSSRPARRCWCPRCSAAPREHLCHPCSCGGPWPGNAQLPAEPGQPHGRRGSCRLRCPRSHLLPGRCWGGHWRSLARLRMVPSEPCPGLSSRLGPPWGWAAPGPPCQELPAPAAAAAFARASVLALGPVPGAGWAPGAVPAALPGASVVPAVPDRPTLPVGAGALSAGGVPAVGTGRQGSPRGSVCGSPCGFLLRGFWWGPSPPHARRVGTAGTCCPRSDGSMVFDLHRTIY